VALEGVTESTIVDLKLASSSRAVRLPETIATRPGQWSVGFEIDFASPGSDREAVITAQLGEESVEETVTLLAGRKARLRVPGRQAVVYGSEMRFRVEAADPQATLRAGELPAGASFDAVSGEFAWTPNASQQGSYDLSFTAVDPGGERATEHVQVVVDAGAPVVTKLVNAATRSAEAVCSPRGIASLEGRWLDGAAVRINGMPAPVLSTDSTRLDFLCPDAAPGSALDVVVETAAGITQPVRTTAREVTPGIFTVDGSGRGQGLISHHGGSNLVMVRNHRYPSQPARAGDTIAVYATGIERAAGISVKVGDIEAAPLAVEQLSGRPGVYRIVLALPGVNQSTEPVIRLTLLVRGSDGSVVASNPVNAGTER
jgi:uncharacterized protein (TIGR03437 family)